MKTNQNALIIGFGVAVISGVALAPRDRAAAKNASPDAPTKAWRTGPVSCLITPDEDRNYKGLKTDEERAEAIRNFWARRDPTPGTVRNEYKEEFYKRVHQAQEYWEGGPVGWVTDRGRMFLTLGPPDDVSFPTWGYVWSYTVTFPPGERKWAGETVRFEVAFVKEGQKYRMAHEGYMLLNAVRKLEPLDVAKLSLSRPLHP